MGAGTVGAHLPSSIPSDDPQIRALRRLICKFQIVGIDEGRDRFGCGFTEESVPSAAITDMGKLGACAGQVSAVPDQPQRAGLC
jgi:hypothetical protein